MSTVRDGQGTLHVLENKPRPPEGNGPVVGLRRHDFLPQLPCEACVHEDVCSIRRTLEATRFAMLEPVLPPEVRVLVRTSVQCEYFQPGRARRRPRLEVVPPAEGGDGEEPIPVAGERRSGKLGRDRDVRNARVAEAVSSTDSLSAAAAKLGVSHTRVKQVLDEMRARGELPADVEAVITGRDRGHQYRRRP